MDQRKKTYIYGIAAYILVCITLYFADPSMKAYHATDFSAPFWYYITISGNFLPQIVIMIVLFIILFLINKSSQKRMISSALIILVIAGASITSGAIANYFLKDLFHTSRPSHKVFLDDGFIPSGLDSFYLKNNLLRKEYLTEHVDPKDAKLSGLYGPDVNMWINEVGGSFPSGHSLNSFLIGTLFSYLLLLFLQKKYQYLCFVPLLWAMLVSLSRYFVGVHEKIDIIGGAFIGLGLALLIIRLNVIGRINSKFSIPQK